MLEFLSRPLGGIITPQWNMRNRLTSMETIIGAASTTDATKIVNRTRQNQIGRPTTNDSLSFQVYT